MIYPEGDPMGGKEKGLYSWYPGKNGVGVNEE